MSGKRAGFVLFEWIIVGAILGVLAGVVSILIPRPPADQWRIHCLSNVKGLANLLILGSGADFPAQSGANLLLVLVVKGDLQGKSSLKTLFCPGDLQESWEKAGGAEAYRDLDLSVEAKRGHLTSYAGRDQLDPERAAQKGGERVILVCDDSEDHHGGKGIVVGWSDGGAQFLGKADYFKLGRDVPLVIGADSTIEELRCLMAD
ncbi:MAG: hypothetical protein ACT4PV_13710 [Planctomycetaceae bacterium]